MQPHSTLAVALATFTLLAPRAADAQRLVAANAPEAQAPTQDASVSLAAALVSPVAELRRGALEGTMARVRGGAGPLHTETVVPALLAVYASDSEVRFRLGAVVTLHAIGDAAAMAELRRRVPSQPARAVRVATLGALVDHYGLDALAGAADLAAVADELLRSSRPQR